LRVAQHNVPMNSKILPVTPHLPEHPYTIVLVVTAAAAAERRMASTA